MFLARVPMVLALALMASACGAPPEVRLKQIHQAASKGDLATVQQMLEGQPGLLHAINDTREKLTLLHMAAYSNNDALVEFLLQRGADPNLRDGKGQTPLFGAASTGNVRSVQMLIAGGAKVDARNAGNDTPLHRAITDSRADTARVLIDHKADVNAVNSNGMTPLHVALDKAEEPLVELLLDRGADVNKRTGNGKSPLRLAVGRDDLIKMLMDRGAKP